MLFIKKLKILTKFIVLIILTTNSLFAGITSLSIFEKDGHRIGMMGTYVDLQNQAYETFLNEYFTMLSLAPYLNKLLKTSACILHRSVWAPEISEQFENLKREACYLPIIYQLSRLTQETKREKPDLYKSYKRTYFISKPTSLFQIINPVSESMKELLTLFKPIKNDFNKILKPYIFETLFGELQKLTSLNLHPSEQTALYVDKVRTLASYLHKLENLRGFEIWKEFYSTQTLTELKNVLPDVHNFALTIKNFTEESEKQFSNERTSLIFHDITSLLEQAKTTPSTMPIENANAQNYFIEQFTHLENTAHLVAANSSVLRYFCKLRFLDHIDVSLTNDVSNFNALKVILENQPAKKPTFVCAEEHHSVILNQHLTQLGYKKIYGYFSDENNLTQNCDQVSLGIFFNSFLTLNQQIQ